MDVHPSKTGINRYWCIATWNQQFSTIFSAPHRCLDTQIVARAFWSAAATAQPRPNRGACGAGRCRCRWSKRTWPADRCIDLDVVYRWLQYLFIYLFVYLFIYLFLFIYLINYLFLIKKLQGYKGYIPTYIGFSRTVLTYEQGWTMFIPT